MGNYGSPASVVSLSEVASSGRSMPKEIVVGVEGAERS